MNFKGLFVWIILNYQRQSSTIKVCEVILLAIKMHTEIFNDYQEIEKIILKLGPDRVLLHLITKNWEIFKTGNVVGNELLNFKSSELAIYVSLNLCIQKNMYFSENTKLLLQNELDDFVIMLGKLNDVSHSKLINKSMKIGKNNRTYYHIMLSTLETSSRQNKNSLDFMCLNLRNSWRKTDYIRRQKISLPLISGFNSLEYHILFALLGVAKNGVIHIPDLLNLLGPGSSSILDLYVKDIKYLHLKSNEKIIEQAKKSLISLFDKIPFFRFGEFIIYPDPGLLYNGIEERLTYLSRNNLEPHLFNETKRALGFTYETSIQNIIQDNISFLGGQLVNEFEYESEKSPDAHIIYPKSNYSQYNNDKIILFEMKGTRLSTVFEEKDFETLNFKWIYTLIEKLSGKTKDNTSFSQILTFLKHWKNKNSSIINKLGQLALFDSYDSFYYIIVSPISMPGFVNLKKWKEDYLYKNLYSLFYEDNFKLFFDRTLFISTEDLIESISFLKDPYYQSLNKTLFDVINDYLISNDRLIKRLNKEGQFELAGSLSDYIKSEYYYNKNRNMPTLNILDDAYMDVVEDIKNSRFHYVK